MQRTEENRVGLGEAIVLAASAALVVALWQPFYSFRLNDVVAQQMRDGLAGIGLQPQAGGLFNGLIHVIQGHAIPIDAWHAFDYIQIGLVAAAGLAAGAVLLRISGAAPSAPGVRQVAMAAGATALALVLYRIVHRPLPSELLTLGWGAWMALVASAGLLAGGALSGASHHHQPVAAPAAPATPYAPAGDGRFWAGS